MGKGVVMITPKQKAHTAMVNLAQTMFGHSIRFAAWCIVNSYDKVTLAQIAVETAKLQKEKDRK